MSAIAMVFPGQGSQSVGMLGELAADPDYGELVAATFAEASDRLGRDLWQLVCRGPAETLDQTGWTQPAMLAGDIAVWRVWRALGGATPLALAGHSLGEYAALVASGAIEFADAVAVVHERGRLMQEASAEGEGAMAAILGLQDEAVEEICEQTGAFGDVVPANYNAPGQVVIAGKVDAVESAMQACREAGAKRALKLAVSVPAHSPLMAPAISGLEIVLSQIGVSTPEIEVLHNVDLESRLAPEAIRRALVEQLTRPVPWTQTIDALRARGVKTFLECGPGKVLTGLGRRIDRDLDWLALESPDALRQAARELGGGK